MANPNPVHRVRNFRQEETPMSQLTSPLLNSELDGSLAVAVDYRPRRTHQRPQADLDARYSDPASVFCLWPADHAPGAGRRPQPSAGHRR